MAPKFKKGELWKVRIYEHEDFFAVFLIEETTDSDEEISVSEYHFQTEEFTAHTSWVDPFDEKITDPAEIAYWLLRFENERNKNE